MRKFLFSFAALMMALVSCSAEAGSNAGNKNNDTINNTSNKTTMATPTVNAEDVMVDIKTSLGDIRVLLYGETPSIAIISSNSLKKNSMKVHSFTV